MKALQTDAFSNFLHQDLTLMDTREASAFKLGLVTGSINIPFNSNFVHWAVSLLTPGEPLIFIADNGVEVDVLNALAVSGFDQVKGYLAGGFESWKTAGLPADLILDVDADELMMDLPYDDRLIVVDVRTEAEFAEGHLANAINIPLADMKDPLSFARFEEQDNLYLHSGEDTRSVMAASLFKRQGMHNVRVVNGGWHAIKKQPRAEIEKDPERFN